MRIIEGHTYTFEFRDVVTGEITTDSVRDYDLHRNSPITRALRKAIDLETEWVPLVGYFPNTIEYNREVRLSGYYHS